MDGAVNQAVANTIATVGPPERAQLDVQARRKAGVDTSFRPRGFGDPSELTDNLVKEVLPNTHNLGKPLPFTSTEIKPKIRNVRQDPL